MNRKFLWYFLAIVALSFACRSISSISETKETKPEIVSNLYTNDHFEFAIPEGWKTKQEIWGDLATTEDNFYGLGLQEIITIQYPAKAGEGNAFFSVASSPLAGGADLTDRFNAAYDDAIPAIQDAEKLTFNQGTLTGQQITYRRPWGEPWWNFHDVWLEEDAIIYVLSFHTTPAGEATYAEIYKQILNSFKFR